MKHSKKDLLVNKLIYEIPDPRNAKEHYQSFIRKKKYKFSKKIRNNYLSTIADINSVITKHPKTSHKLPKTERVGSNHSLYSDTKKVKTF